MLRNPLVKLGAASLFGAVLLLLPFSQLDKAEDERYVEQLAQANQQGANEEQTP